MTRVLPDPAKIQLLEIAGNAIVGGMEMSVLRLVERLPRERFAVTVLCPFEGRFADALRQHGADVYTVAMPPEDASWPSVQQASTLIRARGVHVIHAHLGNAHILAALAGAVTGRPVLATIHGRQITMLDFEAQRLADTHLHLVCRQAQLHALGLGVDAGHLHHVANGVDLDVFQPGARTATRLREQLRIPPDAPLVGFVGRLSWEKGPDVFLRSALMTHTRVPQAHFALFGDGPMRDELSARIEQFGLRGHVHLAGVQEEMTAAYAQMDVLVSTSHTEAMPLVIMEAMASGVPVIATRVGGVVDLVQHGSTGWLVAPDDARQVAVHLVSLLADAAQRTRMGASAREVVRARFDIATSLAAMTQLIARLSGG